ncbi:hypothetical protein SUGI_0942100 [Cryptomeria japonica]|nr:hypothetical protein SUGI_0942100 [Cryptomeria japonica]
MDKSNAIHGKRLASIRLENTKAKCQAYQQLLISTLGLGQYISGAILFVLTQFEEQAKSLVIITMPSRPMHHLAESNDEKYFAQLNETHQTLFFSITLPRLLANFAKEGLQDPLLVRLDLENKMSPNLKFTFFTLRHEDKYVALQHLVIEQIGSLVNEYPR